MARMFARKGNTSGMMKYQDQAVSMFTEMGLQHEAEELKKEFVMRRIGIRTGYIQVIVMSMLSNCAAQMTVRCQSG